MKKIFVLALILTFSVSMTYCGDDSDSSTDNSASTSSGTTAGGDTAGGTTASGDTAGGTTAGGDTAGGTTTSGDTAGGTTAGGTTAGGSDAKECTEGAGAPTKKFGEPALDGDQCFSCNALSPLIGGYCAVQFDDDGKEDDSSTADVNEQQADCTAAKCLELVLASEPGSTYTEADFYCIGPTALTAGKNSCAPTCDLSKGVDAGRAECAGVKKSICNPTPLPGVGFCKKACSGNAACGGLDGYICASDDTRTDLAKIGADAANEADASTKALMQAAALFDKGTCFDCNLVKPLVDAGKIAKPTGCP